MTVYPNLVDSAQAIVLAMRKIGIDCETPSNRVSGLVFLGGLSMTDSWPCCQNVISGTWKTLGTVDAVARFVTFDPSLTLTSDVKAGESLK